MKDILICICLLMAGFIVGIQVERKYPDRTNEYLPNKSTLTRVHYLNAVTPTGVEATGTVLFLHEGGRVSWRDFGPQ